MSRILNRPMFRGGGKVSSYGNGITSGLTNSYAGGGKIDGHKISRDGRVKFNIAGLVSPGMASEFAQGQGNLTKLTGQQIADNARVKVDRPFRYGTKVRKFVKNVPKAVRAIPSGIKAAAIANPATAMTAATAGVFAPVAGLAYLNRPKTVEALQYMKQMNETGVFDETDPDGFEEYSETFKELNETGTPLSESEVGLFSSKKSISEDIMDRDMAEFEEGMAPGAEREDGESALDALLRQGLERAETRDSIENPDKKGEGDVLDVKSQIARDKELFAELLGGDKARGKDVSDMLLRFAGSGGDTVGEKFQQYLTNEAQAGPSRTEKINQAAASLAINDYVAGKRSKESMEMMIKKGENQIDYSIAATTKAKDLKGKPFSTALAMEAAARGKDSEINDNEIIQSVIYQQSDGKETPRIVNDYTQEVADGNLDIDPNKLSTGLNIVTFLNNKLIIRKKSDGSLEVAEEYPIYR
jgi:hypothetical protein